jgi:hypothetical protein
MGDVLHVAVTLIIIGAIAGVALVVRVWRVALELKQLFSSSMSVKHSFKANRVWAQQAAAVTCRAEANGEAFASSVWLRRSDGRVFAQPGDRRPHNELPGRRDSRRRRW